MLERPQWTLRRPMMAWVYPLRVCSNIPTDATMQAALGRIAKAMGAYAAVSGILGADEPFSYGVALTCAATLYLGTLFLLRKWLPPQRLVLVGSIGPWVVGTIFPGSLASVTGAAVLPLLAVLFVPTANDRVAPFVGAVLAAYPVPLPFLAEALGLMALLLGALASAAPPAGASAADLQHWSKAWVQAVDGVNGPDYIRRSLMMATCLMMAGDSLRRAPTELRPVAGVVSLVMMATALITAYKFAGPHPQRVIWTSAFVNLGVQSIRPLGGLSTIATTMGTAYVAISNLIDKRDALSKRTINSALHLLLWSLCFCACVLVATTLSRGLDGALYPMAILVD